MSQCSVTATRPPPKKSLNCARERDLQTKRFVGSFQGWAGPLTGGTVSAKDKQEIDYDSKALLCQQNSVATVKLIAKGRAYCEMK